MGNYRFMMLMNTCFRFRFGFLKDQSTTNNQVVVPTCKYNDKIGSNITGYNQSYCDESVFQPTFNEYGMCYTFNNRKQGMDQYFSSRQSDFDKEDLGAAMNSTKRDIDFVAHHSLENGEKEIFKVSTTLLQFSAYLLSDYILEYTLYLKSTSNPNVEIIQKQNRKSGAIFNGLKLNFFRFEDVVKIVDFN